MDGINISSNSSSMLGKALTNPTELAVYRGKLKGTVAVRNAVKVYGRSGFGTFTGLCAYPIVDRQGNWYTDVEAAWQVLKKRFSYSDKLMIKLIRTKLKMYPALVEEIKERGGVEFLKASSHIVIGGDWEGHGESSRFIRCLIEAYKGASDV